MIAVASVNSQQPVKQRQQRHHPVPLNMRGRLLHAALLPTVPDLHHLQHNHPVPLEMRGIDLLHSIDEEMDRKGLKEDSMDELVEMYLDDDGRVYTWKDVLVGYITSCDRILKLYLNRSWRLVNIYYIYVYISPRYM